ncbi:MAG TPA: DUF711 domain-containing protein [Ktedonobacter sp.]|nr:DUF711 domain-containing protein [Ktedonobacter sp.]
MHHPIRTLTLGIAEPHPLSSQTIAQAATLLHNAQTHFTNEGYEVQTVRISTRPLFDDLTGWSQARIYGYTKELQQQLDDVQVAFCSLGTVQAARPATPLDQIEQVVDILAATSALNMTVQLADVEHGIREEAALPVAQVIQRLAHETEEGSGNFRFAMLACVAPGSPFFPSAYHDGPTSLSLGLQGAGIVADAITRLHQERGQGASLPYFSGVLREELLAQAQPVVELAQTIAHENALKFGGIDLSPAPMADDSIVAALEQYGMGRFGEAGTLAVSAAITAALKSTNLPTCGYNGLMLPVLEDRLLGQRWSEGHINAHQLLLYSAVCGTGLDTVPFPADTPVNEVARLLLDVATLAVRLNKPLSARLFPVPNVREGTYTEFRSPYLTNTILRRLF